jgi:hypothetical protein
MSEAAISLSIVQLKRNKNISWLRANTHSHYDSRTDRGLNIGTEFRVWSLTKCLPGVVYLLVNIKCWIQTVLDSMSTIFTNKNYSENVGIRWQILAWQVLDYLEDPAASGRWLQRAWYVHILVSSRNLVQNVFRKDTNYSDLHSRLQQKRIRFLKQSVQL